MVLAQASVIPAPISAAGEPNHDTEIVRALQSLLGKDRSADSTQPIAAILRAQHQVVVAHDLWPVILEKAASHASSRGNGCGYRAPRRIDR